MKKLNNQEINAVAYKIQREIEDNNTSIINTATKPKDVWEKEFKKTIKYKEFAKIDLLISSFKDTYNFDMSGWIDRNERIPAFINKCYKQYTEKVKKRLNLKYPSLESIKSKIIIAQIECENLQEIIDNIKKEYNLIVE